jgi:transposase
MPDHILRKWFSVICDREPWKTNYDRQYLKPVLFCQMQNSEQGFAIKFFFLKRFDSKPIHRKLTAVLGSTAYSLTQIKEWRARFKAGDLSCEDKFRSGRPPRILGKAISYFLGEFRFGTAGIIAHHFTQSTPTIKEVLQREFGLQIFSRRWVPHSLSDAHKADRIVMATDLLSVRYPQVGYSFLRLWQRTSPGFSIDIPLTICWQRAKIIAWTTDQRIIFGIIM